MSCFQGIIEAQSSESEFCRDLEQPSLTSFRISVTPASLYLGVLPRGTILDKKIEITSGKSAMTLEVVSSNPDFASKKTRKSMD